MDGQDEEIGQDVASAHHHQDLRILKGNLLGQLHHHQDDGEIGTVRSLSVSVKIYNRNQEIGKHTFEETPFCRVLFRYGEIVEYGGVQREQNFKVVGHLAFLEGQGAG